MFLETCLLIASTFFDPGIISLSQDHAHQLKMSRYTALRDFLLLPYEIRNNIKCILIQLIKNSERYFYLKNNLYCINIFTTAYSAQLDQKESKCADFNPEDPNEDRYCSAEYFKDNRRCGYPYSPYYYLTICRAGIGPLCQLNCYQREISLVTVKDEMVHAYYKRDDAGYDIQIWPIGKKRIKAIINSLDSLQLILLCNCFEHQKKVQPISFKSPFRKIYETIPENIKSRIFDTTCDKILR